MTTRPAIQPRGMRVEQAAFYVGMGRTKFLELVENKTFPQPLHIDGLRIWDVRLLDATLDDLSQPSPTPKKTVPYGGLKSV